MGQMSIQIVMMLPPEAASVSLARHTLAGALRVADVTAECSDEAQVALSEACTNVFEHAAAGQNFEVLINVGDAVLTMHILDSGPGFPGGHRLAAWPAIDAESGRGLILMNAFTDDASFDSKGGNGSVRLKKKLRRNARAPVEQSGRFGLLPEGEGAMAGESEARRRQRGAEERDRVADERDRIAEERDLVAEVREDVADERDRIAAQRAEKMRRPLTDRDADGGIERAEAAQERHQAQQQRDLAADLRNNAATKRDHADEARDRAAEERQADRERNLAADRRDREAGRRDREAERRDREAERRERGADRREAQADQRARDQDAVLDDVNTVEADANVEVLVERADQRDLRAEQRDRLAEERDSFAAIRDDDSEEARADRASAARDRHLGAKDRDEAAGDRADLRDVYKQARRPPGTAPHPQPGSDERRSKHDDQDQSDEKAPLDQQPPSSK
jgi:sulfite oxidase